MEYVKSLSNKMKNTYLYDKSICLHAETEYADGRVQNVRQADFHFSIWRVQQVINKGDNSSHAIQHMRAMRNDIPKQTHYPIMSHIVVSHCICNLFTPVQSILSEK